MKVNARKRSEATKIRLPESAHRVSSGDSDGLSSQPHVISVHVPITGVPVNAPKTAPVQMMESDPEEKEGWKRERELAANNASYGEFKPSGLSSMGWSDEKIRSWPSVRMQPKQGGTVGEAKLRDDRIAHLDQIKSLKKPEEENQTEDE